MLGSLLLQVEAVKSLVGGPSRALSLCLVGLLSVTLVPVVHAQDRPLPPGLAAGQLERPQVQPACFVHTMPSAAPASDAARVTGPSTLLASCSGAGVVLGEADSYRVHYNPASGALVVSIERGERTRIMLLQRDADGQLAIEDITGDLAVAAGRGPTSGLRGASIDFAGFARDGVIAVADEGQASEARVNLPQAGRPFSLTDHNDRRRAVAAAADAVIAGEAQ